MSDEYTFEDSNFNVPGTILVHEDDQIVWQTETEPSESFASNGNATLSESYMTATEGENTLSESYMTAPDSDNATQYLSVLDSSSETILNDISHINVGAGSYEYVEASEDALNTTPATCDDVVIFRVDGSDDLYGLQVAEDEEGNVHRYQFQVIQNENGDFEPVPGTVQIVENEEIPADVVPSEIPELSSQDVDKSDELNDKSINDVDCREKIFFKQEIVHDDIDEANTPEDQLQVDETYGDEEDNRQTYQDEEQTYASYGDSNFDEDSAEDVKDPNIIKKTEIIESNKLNQTNKPNQEENFQETYDNIYITQEHDEEFEETHHQEKCDTKDGILSGGHSNSSHDEQELNNKAYNLYITQEQEQIPEEDAAASEIVDSADINQNVEEHNSSDSEYEILDGAHITGEEFYEEDADDFEPLEPKGIRSNILANPIAADNYLLRRRVPERNCYYLIKSTEKENVETDARYISQKPKLTNVRSILKTSHTVKLEIKQPIVERRFARSKEAFQARIYQNMISQTKIIHAPIRQERLPRKQQIKPLERLGEEIVVQEVCVSSNGYIETREDGVLKNRKPIQPSEFIQLDDSDDEHKKKRKRKLNRRKSLIVISDSEEEHLENVVVLASPPKKQRGRKTINDKTATELKKLENQCTKCPKSFPSIGSLRTHMHVHNFEVTQKNEKAIPENSDPTKHKCTQCKDVFKNNILLTKHMNLHKNANKIECQVCKKMFTDRTLLLAHKRSHVKDQMFKSTTTLKQSPKKQFKSPIKRLQSPTKRVDLKCNDCGKVFPTPMLLQSHMKTHKRFTCTTCSSKFISKLLLDKHVREDCVKNKPPVIKTHTNSRISYVPRKSIINKRITRSSMIQPPSATKLKTAALNISVKCDSCDSVFNTHTTLFKHKVVMHGLSTPDKTIGKEVVKKSLYKPIGEHSGIMPNQNLKKTFAKLRNILETQTTNDTN